MSDSPRYAPHPDAGWRIVDDHVFIITDDSRQHELDGAVELFVWRACAGRPMSRAELAAAVADAFAVSMDQAETDLDRFLVELVSARVAVELRA